MPTKRAPLDPGLVLDMAAICAAIEDERIRRGLSHGQSAQELGIPYRTMANWRQGVCGINGDALLRICWWTGRSIETFARVPADAPASRTEAA